MSVTSQSIGDRLLSAAPAAANAANADDVGDSAAAAPVQVGTTETASGWDAYEVWRRFIKEARDRREASGVTHK